MGFRERYTDLGWSPAQILQSRLLPFAMTESISFSSAMMIAANAVVIAASRILPAAHATPITPATRIAAPHVLPWMVSPLPTTDAADDAFGDARGRVASGRCERNFNEL